MMELHSMVEPGRAYTADALRAEETEEDEQGDDIDSRDGPMPGAGS